MIINLFKVFIAFLAIITILVVGTDVRVETRVFCAYNKLFVEFESRGKSWGTMMLDDNGVPIRCKDDDATPIRLPNSRNITHDQSI